MKIFLGTDHAGFEMKESIKTFLASQGHEVYDCGSLEYDKNDDYPDFVSIAAQKVSENSESFGIVFGYSGAGECIVANKIKGIRAILGVNEENVTLSREHNNANVLSLGSHFTDTRKAEELVNLFLTIPFSNEERHIRRINKISDLEKNGI